MDNSPLFIEVASKTAILLVDRSGSTNDVFTVNSNRDIKRIFHKMGQVCNELPHDSFYVIFWSSPDYNMGDFKNGVSVVPFKVNRGAALTAVFDKIFTSYSGSGTCPCLGFQSINVEWLKDEPMVYLVTDGQIGCVERYMPMQDNRRRLVSEIQKLNTQFSIIAVESVDRNFSNVENVNNAAGGDIYNIIVDNKLTGKLSKFISYSPSGSFVQIDKVKPIAGYVPYGNKCFSISRVSEFIEFIRNEITRDSSEDNQINIAQKLSATLEVLTRDKPRSLANDIIRAFSSLFTIDRNIINYLMIDAVNKERAGTAQVVANYRHNLKNLFAQASNAIKTDVSSAIGLDEYELFVSPIIDGNILIGMSRNACKNVSIWDDVYKRAGWNSCVPAFPVLPTNISVGVSTGGVSTGVNLLRDQCLRQWIRIVYAELYNMPAVSDQIIYLVICDMLRVWKTTRHNVILESRTQVMNAYRELARCMLRKGRLNSNKTELDVLLEGNLPTTNNGSHDEFVSMFKSCMHLTGISSPEDTSGWKVCWYEACYILYTELAVKQRKHCFDATASSSTANSSTASSASAGLSFTKQIDIQTESESSIYDYNCLITLEDLSNIGGYKILGHIFGNSTCNPIYLLSENGMRELLEKNSYCPVCYSHITDRDFQKVGPKVAANFEINYDIGKFKANVVSSSSSSSGRSCGPASGRSCGPASGSARNVGRNASGPAIRNANGNTGTVVVMKGTVGAGKTTYSEFIKQTVERRGGVCLTEGTDKYCVRGDRVPDAVKKVENTLRSIQTNSNDDIVVVIDTCGERNNNNNFFNVDFTGWKIVSVWPNLDRNDILGYLAWTWRNILRRRHTELDSAYWLNPEESGVLTCKMVHIKKAKALKLVPKKVRFNYDMNEQQLNEQADAYAAKNVRAFTMPVGV